MRLSPVDHRILEELQRGIPVCERPWEAIGEKVGLPETELLGRVRGLREQRGAIRRIGAIFDGRTLGYHSALVAVSVPGARVAGAAAAIGTHPGVSHNYERDAEFNLWYTIAVPADSSLERTVERLAELAAASRSLNLPEVVRYKIGVRLDTAASAPGDREEPPEPVSPSNEPAPPLSETDRLCVRVLPEDLPLDPRPFRVLAQRVALEETDLLGRVEAFRRCGRLRRLAAVLRHREVGFVANAMGVWRVDDERADEVGRVMASFRRVSHCYRRPAYPEWPYHIYTMIHGRSREECAEIARLISCETGVEDYGLLFSGREFKKSRVRYFAPEFEQWENALLRERPAGVPGRPSCAAGFPAMAPLLAKVRSRDETARLVRAIKRSGRTVAFANGCFDVLHAGHVRFLEGARALGDVLVVGINSDSSVRDIKGEGRPLLPEAARAALVASLCVVDHVVLFHERTADALLRELEPDVHAKGTDYTEETVPERETVLAFGGRVAIVGDPKGHSTRDLIESLRRRGPRDAAP